MTARVIGTFFLLSNLVHPGAAQEIVSPRIAGTLHPIDGGEMNGVRVIARCGEAADSTTVDPSGSFSIALACGPGGGELEILDPGGRYYPTLSGLPPKPRPGGLVALLVPRAWEIASGTHAGSRVPVDLRSATRPACSYCTGFYRKENEGDPLHGRQPGITAWLEHSLPLRVAFDHEEGATLTARDSAAFMKVAEALETDLGRRWFRASSMQDIFSAPDGDPFGSLIVSIDPLLSTAGRGNFVSQGGEILAGIVFLQSTRYIHDPRSAGTVAHEIMHTLGFGHTCGWRSVMANEACPSRRADAPTAEDVAHAQLLIRLRTLERKFGIYGTVAAALAGAERFPLAVLPAAIPSPPAGP